MSDNMKLHLIYAIENSISLICCTALAIAFEKWWLILLYALFYIYVGKGDAKS